MRVGNLIMNPVLGVYLLIEQATTYTGIPCYRFIGTNRADELFRGKLSVEYLMANFKVISCG